MKALVRFFLLSILWLPCNANGQSVQGEVSKRGASFDFIDTDIKVVLSALAEAGGINIAFGPLPARNVTLRTAQPLQQQELATVLTSMAESNGLRVVREGNLVRIAVMEAPISVAAPQSMQAPRATDEDIHVYHLKHIPASKAASVLQSLLGAAVSVSSDLSQRSTLTDQLRSQRIPSANQQAGVGSVATLMSTSNQPSNLFVVAEDLSNSLLIRGTPDQWAAVQRTIQLVDIRPLEVLIDVLIAEVRRSSNDNSGVSITLPNQALSDSRGGSVDGALHSQSAGEFALNVLEIGHIRADVALSALSAKSNISILSRPVIIAQNNTEARILVGSQRPFIQVTRALPTESAVRDQVVQYRDVGTSLTLTPTINPDGYVNLALQQEISNATSELQFGAPVISTREASTTLLVKDGQTAVIGGLIDHQLDRARSGIPLLKDIPILGWLFGGHTRNSSTTELFLFLTPHVVRTDEDVDRIRKDVQDNTEYLQKSLRRLPPFLPDTAHHGGK